MVWEALLIWGRRERNAPRGNEGVKRHDQADQAGERHAVLEDDLEDLGLTADLLGRGTRDDDRLCVDHLPHDAPARVGRSHQDRADAEPLGGDFLKVAEEHIRTRVGARQGHSQPAQQGPEEGEGGAGPSQAQRPSTVSMPEYRVT